MPDKPRVASPEVVAFAEKTGLDLTGVAGTGPSGRITYQDAVTARWEGLRPAIASATGLDASASWLEIKAVVDSRLRPRAIRAGLSPDATLPQIEAREETLAREAAANRAILAPPPAAAVSRVAAKGPGYALNPMVDRVRAEAAASGVAAPVAPAPTLFASGDLPAVTASGIPPETLLSVPATARHALAAAPTTEAAYKIVQDCTAGIRGEGDGEQIARAYYSDHPGNADYAQRVQAWQQSAITDEQIEAEFESRFPGFLGDPA